ncbi:MAG: DUF4153 domain-containing protein [Lachnospiraceae bacterium]
MDNPTNVEKDNITVEENMNAQPVEPTPETVNAQQNQPAPQKTKKNMKERMKNTLHSFLSVFMEFPVTIASIVIAAIFALILMDADYNTLHYDNVNKTMIFFLVFASGTLFFEEFVRFDKFLPLYKKMPALKWLFEGAGLIIAAIVGVITVYYMGFDEYTKAAECFSRFLIFWITATILMAIYFMYQRSKESFSKYCLSVFISLFQTTLIYGLFAIGLAIVIAIFDFLILDTDPIDLIGHVELFLAAGIYFPALIICFSRIREKIGGFGKVVVEYALLIILLLAFCVIYLYIFKIIAQRELPRNEIFAMLSWLFAIGLPIWTMAQYYKPQVLGKLASFLPFAFLPFIVLQIICMGLRVSAYGVTMPRYAGIVLIIFEILYVALYAVKMGKVVAYIVPTAVVLVLGAMLLPGVNAFSVSANSQIKRMEEVYADPEEMDNSEIEELRSIYNELKWNCGFEGTEYLEQRFTRSERRKLDNLYNYLHDETDFNMDIKEYSAYLSLNEVDVSGYQSLTNISCYYNQYDESDSFDATNVCFSQNNTSKDYYLDISSLLEELVSVSEEDFYDYVQQNNGFVIDEHHKLVFEHVYIKTADGEYTYVSMDAYLLMK